MSFLDELTSLAGNALNGKLPELVEQAKKAIEDGHAAESPVGKLVAAKALSILPANADSIVDSIDTLLPDSLEASMGITPEIKAFIKRAVAAHQA